MVQPHGYGVILFSLRRYYPDQVYERMGMVAPFLSLGIFSAFVSAVILQGTP